MVKYEKKLGGQKTCISGCQCLTESWQQSANQACISLGDCGIKVNFIGITGYKNISAFNIKEAKAGTTG